ncbi:unnamed protein product [Peniophora sp. CBMAI 1063]|nr:unnamed protein product [Peniophora sp. CBMAI 1063]
MDNENYNPNIVFDDAEASELPDDLELDIWFRDPAVAEFLATVQAIKFTRTVLKGTHPGVERARQILEAKIIGSSTLDWHMRMNTFFIRKCGRRTMIEKAAQVYSTCLQLAVQDALRVKKGMTLTESEIEEHLNGDTVRQYLMKEKAEGHLDDDIEIMYRSKKSFNASGEDNDAVEELYSVLETQGPDDVPLDSPTSELDLSTDEAVQAFELTPTNRASFLRAMTKPDVQLRVCCLWERRLRAYFFECLSGIPENELERLRVDAVTTLTQMKCAPRSTTTKTEEWKVAVTKSGLARLLRQITRTEFMFSWQYQAQKAERAVLGHVLHSLCFHQWAEALSIIFDKWSPKDLEEAAGIIAAEATYPTLSAGATLKNISTYGYDNSAWLKRYVEKREQSAITAWNKNQRRQARPRNKNKKPAEPFVLKTDVTLGESFLGFLGDHPELLPSRYNMQAYFLFLDRPHFLRNFYLWGRAALMLFDYRVDSDKDLDNIYADIMKVKADHLQGLGEGSEKLHLLFKECKRLRDLVKPTSNVTMKNLERKREVTVFPVTALDKELLDATDGKAFTFHASDRIERLPTGKKASNDSSTGIKFIDPREPPYSLQCIKPDEKILKAWGKHVFIFVDTATKAIVGGVIFQAFNERQLEEAIKHHTLVCRFPGLRRGTSFLEFAYGKMIPVGFRVPGGGRPGDEYGPHPIMVNQADRSEKAGDHDDVDMMFAHAEDIEMVFDAVKDYVPEVVNSIRDLSDEKQLKDMGSCGVSSYYCSNYLSQQHGDNDVGWSLCSQLYKKLDTAGGSPTEDFNFAFTKWGVYIETQANCVWWFRSEDLHGSIMPTNSTIQSLRQQATRTRRATTQPRAQRLRGGAGSDVGSDAESNTSHIAVAGSPPPPTTGSGGIHVTVRKKDADRAERFARTQRRAAARNAYWQGRE